MLPAERSSFPRTTPTAIQWRIYMVLGGLPQTNDSRCRPIAGIRQRRPSQDAKLAYLYRLQSSPPYEVSLLSLSCSPCGRGSTHYGRGADRTIMWQCRCLAAVQKIRGDTACRLQIQHCLASYPWRTSHWTDMARMSALAGSGIRNTCISCQQTNLRDPLLCRRCME